MNVVTVAFYCTRSMVIFVFISDPYCYVDRQRTAALGAIKGDEPSLTAAATASQVNATSVKIFPNICVWIYLIRRVWTCSLPGIKGHILAPNEATQFVNYLMHV